MKSKSILTLAFFFLPVFIIVISCQKDEQEPNKSDWATVLSIDKPDSWFLDIDFKDEHTGYALSVEGVKGDQSIWVTYDGGKSWKQNSFIFKGEGLHNIAICDSILFAIGKFMYTSVDEGLSWVKVNPPLEGYGVITFFNNNIGIVTQGNFFSRSTDWGKTWTIVFSSDIRAPFLKFFFTTNNSGYAIAGATYDNTNYGVVAKTMDDGLNWRILEKRFANVTDLYFLNATTGFIFTFDKELFKTKDGGDTWELINAQVPDNHPSSFFLSENEAYLGGTSGIFYTSDGGINWKHEYEEEGLIVNRIAYNGKSLLAVTNNGKILTKEINQ